MSYIEKAKNQLNNQRTLITHVDRALTTITKFENSHIDATRLPVHGTGAGRYIYLEDLMAIRKELVSYANYLESQFKAAEAIEATKENEMSLRDAANRGASVVFANASFGKESK